APRVWVRLTAMVLSVVVNVLLVAAVGALIAVLINTRDELESQRRRADELDERHASAKAELEATTAKLAEAERALSERDAELATARERGDAARLRAETAEAALRETHERLDAALRESASVSSKLEAVRE